MFEYVTLTGEIKDGHIGCSHFGRNFYAKPLFLTAFQSVPSKKWLEKYAKEFFGVVGYIQEQYEKPVFFGVVPINATKYHEPAIDNKHYIVTEKFKVSINDDASTTTIEFVEGNSFVIKEDSITINSNQIFLTGDAAIEQAVLGNRLQESLNNLVNCLATATTMTALGPQPFMPSAQTTLQTILGELDLILSDKVKLS